jgi:hypothetical protein
MLTHRIAPTRSVRPDDDEPKQQLARQSMNEKPWHKPEQEPVCILVAVLTLFVSPPVIIMIMIIVIMVIMMKVMIVIMIRVTTIIMSSYNSRIVQPGNHLRQSKSKHAATH